MVLAECDPARFGALLTIFPGNAIREASKVLDLEESVHEMFFSFPFNMFFNQIFPLISHTQSLVLAWYDVQLRSFARVLQWFPHMIAGYVLVFLLWIPC